MKQTLTVLSFGEAIHIIDVKINDRMVCLHEKVVERVESHLG